MKVGENIKTVRMLLDWTQADLAKQTGLSRVTIVNIEREPWRMTRTSALAIFFVIFTEIMRRKQHLEKLSIPEYVDWPKLLNDVGLTNLRTWSCILGPTELVSTGFIPALKVIKSLTDGTSSIIIPTDHKKLRNAVTYALNKLSVTLCQLFILKELSMDSFLNNLNVQTPVDR